MDLSVKSSLPTSNLRNLYFWSCSFHSSIVVSREPTALPVRATRAVVLAAGSPEAGGPRAQVRRAPSAQRPLVSGPGASRVLLAAAGAATPSGSHSRFLTWRLLGQPKQFWCYCLCCCLSHPREPIQGKNQHFFCKCLVLILI